MRKSSGAILRRGASALARSIVVATIVTGLTGFRTENKKTGPMDQVWYLVDGINPTEARKTDKDRAICGKCPLRSNGCYPNEMSYGGVYRADEHGKYPNADVSILAGEAVRLGAYGDPAADPTTTKAITQVARMWTGYTHSWRTAAGRKLLGFVQASTENEWDTLEAWRQGWKTFRIKLPWEPLLPGEILCPEEKTDGKIQCITCGLCNGRKANIAVTVHGTWSKVRKFGLLRQLSGDAMDQLYRWWRIASGKGKGDLT